jgi:hypothetical protein
MTTDAEEARLLLKWAEKGYNHKYGSVPIDTRITLAQAWIDLARITNSAEEGESR